MTCSHTVTQGRESHEGSWCLECGEKVYDVDERECKDCEFSSKLIGGWICKKHLMVVTPDMRVTFKISQGSCWTPSNAVPTSKEKDDGH